MPRASSRSIHSPDSRVSRPATKRTGTAGLSCRRARTSAAPSRRTVGGSSGYSPALPRTPSVPNSRANSLRLRLSLWPHSPDDLPTATDPSPASRSRGRCVSTAPAPSDRPRPPSRRSVTVSVALAIDTGSVMASVSPRTARGRTRDHHRRRVARDRTDAKPGAGSPSTRRRHHHDLGLGRFERHRHAGRLHLHDLDAERRPHVGRVQVEQALSPRAPAAGPCTATSSPALSRAERAGRAPHRARPRVGRVADQLQPRRQVGELQRNAHARARRSARPPRAATAARPAAPTRPSGRACADRISRIRQPCSARRRRGRAVRRRRTPSSAPSRSRSVSGVRPRSSRPLIASEMTPVSSDTTIGQRVVLLSQAERGAVARAQLAADPRVHRQRQEAGRRRDPVALHDHRAVVQRRRRLEDAGQQVVGDQSRPAGCRPRCSCAGRSAAR